MNNERFERLKIELSKRGYKIYEQHLYNEDYMICKGFHREDNKWDDTRSPYHIMLLIYDYPKKNWPNLPIDLRNYIGVEVRVNISRVIDEKPIEMTLSWNDKTTIEEIELYAECFYNWVCATWPEPRIQ